MSFLFLQKTGGGVFLITNKKLKFMAKLILKKDSNPNYLASIQKIEEVFPIEGADRLVRTVIGGYDMVISKDMLPGTTVVYFPVECAIAEKYLSANNLYESGEFVRNANHEEVIPFAEAAEKAKNAGDKEEFDKQWSEVKSRCGFFGKSGRVRILKLRGQYSQGFIAGVNSLVNAYPELKNFDFESHVGEQFNYVDDNELCWKYVPPKKETPEHLSGNQKMWRKRMKHLKKFDRLENSDWTFHYDTRLIENAIGDINPESVITITTKCHGTSICLERILVKRQLKTWEKIKKFFGVNVPEKEYDTIYSSRSVIKNQYINPTVQSFYKTDIWGCVARDFGRFLSDDMKVFGEIVGYLEDSQQMIQKDHDYGCKSGQWKFMPYRISTKNDDGTWKEWNIEDVDKWTRQIVDAHPYLSEKVLFLEILYHGKAKDVFPDLDPEQHWHANFIARLKSDKERFHMEDFEHLCHLYEAEYNEAKEHLDKLVSEKASKKEIKAATEVLNKWAVKRAPHEGVVIRIDDDIIPRAIKCKCRAHYEREAMQHDEGETDIEEIS